MYHFRKGTDHVSVKEDISLYNAAFFFLPSLSKVSQNTSEGKKHKSEQ